MKYALLGGLAALGISLCGCASDGQTSSTTTTTSEEQSVQPVTTATTTTQTATQQPMVPGPQ